ncbi:MAG: hydroxyacid dehydrogenase [Puniceicoccaceae bacterium]
MDKNPRITVVLAGWEEKTFMPQAVKDRLSSISDQIVYLDSLKFNDGAEVVEQLKKTEPEILISAWTMPKLTDDTLEQVPSLKYLCFFAGSIKGTVPDVLLEKGLIVTNWGHSVARTVAETGLMLAIGGLRRAGFWTLEMHTRGGWKDRTTVQTGSLFGRKVGLHGFGVISQELRRLLIPFGVPVMTYSPSVPDSLLEEQDVTRANDLEELFSENDVIIELAALTPKNTGIVTEELLRMIPEGGVFVNIGRGAVVDEEALARVAVDGKIQVALDVYGVEPLPADSPFRSIDSILTLPHLGGPTTDRRQDAALFGIDNIERYLAGESLQAQVTVEVNRRIT